MWRHIALHLRPVIHENHDAHACRARYGNQEVLPVLCNRNDLEKKKTFTFISQHQIAGKYRNLNLDYILITNFCALMIIYS